MLKFTGGLPSILNSKTTKRANINVNNIIVDNELQIENTIITADTAPNSINLTELNSNSILNQTTGLLEGGIVTQVGIDIVDISAGRGIIADYTDSSNPLFHNVSWDDFSNVVITGVLFDDATALSFDKDSNLQQIPISTLTNADRRNFIIVGTVGHQAGFIFQVETDPLNLGYTGSMRFLDFLTDVIGPANVSDNIISFNGANLNLNASGGVSYMLTINYRSNNQIPDLITSPSAEAPILLRTFNEADPSQSVIFEAFTTFINPNGIDNNTGVLGTVSNNRWTIQRLHHFPPNDYVISYGQEEFKSSADAVLALGNAKFIEKTPIPDILLRGFLVVQQGTTDLSDISSAMFFEASSFRITGAAGSSASIPGLSAPGGDTTQIQFNDASLFAGDSSFIFDKTTSEVSIGIAPPNAQLGINQVSITGTKPVLALQQNDISEEFINYVSSSGANISNPISTLTGGNSIQGFTRVSINGTFRWIPFYNDPIS